MKNLVRILFMTILVGTHVSCTKKATLKAYRLTKTNVESTVSTISSGTVEAQQQAVLSFGMSGRVAKIHVSEGDKVAGGQILAELESSDLQIIHKNAQDELKRAYELFTGGMVSKAAYDEARRAAEVAKAGLDKALIRAPFEGMITEVNLEIGGLAQAVGSTGVASSPMRIVDLKPRLVKGQIDENDLSKVKVGLPARIKVSSVRAEPFEAVVSKVIPFVSTTREQDRTSRIELNFKDTEAQIPVGSSADVEIIVEKKDGALALPTRTILGSSGQRYVYRVNDKSIAKAQITPGAGNYERTEIVKGLSEGDLVIYPSDELEYKDGMKVDYEIQKWP